jgi:hypothetical protein
MEMSLEQDYARQLHEWRNALMMIETPSITEGEDLSMKFGYLFQDGTIAFSSRNGKMKFPLLDSFVQAIPFLTKIGIKLKHHYDISDSYVILSYRDAISKKDELEKMDFIKELKKMHSEFQTFIRSHHKNDIETGIIVYSDGEVLDHYADMLHFPSFHPETFDFPLGMNGSTGIRHSYALIPTEFTEEVISMIYKINLFIRPIKMAFDEMASEYA